MFGIHDLFTYFIGVVFIILIPGPNSVFCLASTIQYGHKAGFKAMAGVFLGDSILILSSVLGIAALLKANPNLFIFVKLIGGVYLAYLGVKLLIQAYVKLHTEKTINFNTTGIKKEQPVIFKKALLLSILNPKAILFFISFFVQFVDSNYAHPALSFLILALILQIFSMSYLLVLIFFGRLIVKWAAEKKKAAAVGLGSIGGLFIGFAMKLWASTIS